MPESSEQDAILQTALDYFEGWFDGDVERMEKALHPQLVKRSRDRLYDNEPGWTSAQDMIGATRQGEGKKVGANRDLDIEVHDIYEDIASVTVHSAPYHEYLHLLRTGDGWKIVDAFFANR